MHVKVGPDGGERGEGGSPKGALCIAVQRSSVASSSPTPPAGGRGTTRQRGATRPRRAPGQGILREVVTS
jgi:hypothetical protein